MNSRIKNLVKMFESSKEVRFPIDVGNSARIRWEVGNRSTCVSNFDNNICTGGIHLAPFGKRGRHVGANLLERDASEHKPLRKRNIFLSLSQWISWKCAYPDKLSERRDGRMIKPAIGQRLRQFVLVLQRHGIQQRKTGVYVQENSIFKSRLKNAPHTESVNI